MDRLHITLDNGKYTVIQSENGGLHILRYGELWRACTGDNVILTLAYEVAELRDLLGIQKDGDHA